MIAENFESIRSSNEEEYQRTAQAMRAIYRSSTPATAKQILDQAAQRFAEVVDGLKRMAAEMSQELDTTRTELRKGILELPQETAESAAQMRRVIVDQIEALAEAQPHRRAPRPRPRRGRAGRPAGRDP